MNKFNKDEKITTLKVGEKVLNFDAQKDLSIKIDEKPYEFDNENFMDKFMSPAMLNLSIGLKSRVAIDDEDLRELNALISLRDNPLMTNKNSNLLVKFNEFCFKQDIKQPDIIFFRFWEMSLDYNIEVTDEEADGLCKQVFDSLNKNYKKDEDKDLKEHAGEFLTAMNKTILNELKNRVIETYGTDILNNITSVKNQYAKVPYWVDKTGKKSW